MLTLAEKYAALRATQIIAHHLNDDGTITFVLESGPKMTMSAELLKDAINAMQPDEPFRFAKQIEMEEVGSDAPASPSLPANGGAAPEPPKTKKGKGKK